MAELNHRFHKGRMNKDLDERLVPNGEYRNALNVEVVSSEDSNIGSLQTIMGNVDLSTNLIDPYGILDGYCVASIVDEQNDKLYWLIAGNGKDIIAEYDYATKAVAPVVVDIYPVATPTGNNSGRALNFDRYYLITGINIIDGILFWTDNNTEPKKVHIERAKQGSTTFNTQTEFFVRSGSTAAQTVQYVSAGPIQHEHLTVIKKSPPAAPTLEMLSTTREDISGNNIDGEIRTTYTPWDCSVFIDPATQGYYTTSLVINIDTEADFKAGDYIVISHTDSDGNKKELRAIIEAINSSTQIKIQILSGDQGLKCNSDDGEDFFDVILEQRPSLFQFKLPRFGYRYKYEDGEYSSFSPFTEVAFIPGKFDYIPREGYNLGMVNNLRSLAVKNFVHGRLIPEDVIAIDILYKESNSPNVYSVKTIKRKDTQGTKYDEWNAVNDTQTTKTVNTGGTQLIDMQTTGYSLIESEMIHAVLPSNQTLRPYDNVPRKALAQEITGNRLVYANYLQNYNLNNSEKYESNEVGGVGDLQPTNSIDIDVDLGITSRTVGDLYAEQINPIYADFGGLAGSYGPAKSIKTLRTYQLGVVYIDEFGRETPVFSDGRSGKYSLRVPKDSANLESKLKAKILNTPPEWARSYKFFIKETANEYYNLALDRWYNAEDGNIWLSFPSSERNKVDIETFLILKKEHNSNNFVSSPARYKILAIENEAPIFIKTERKPLGEFTDIKADPLIGYSAATYPLPGVTKIALDQEAFQNLGWAKFPPSPLIGTPPSGPGEQGIFYLEGSPTDFEIRFKVPSVGYTNYYTVKNVEWEPENSLVSNLGWYILTLKDSLGDDASITSTTPYNSATNFTNRIDGVELELYKSKPENKPEFEGRFFAKIKKDFTLIETIIIPSSNLIDPQYSVVNAMPVQYINPGAGGTWNWFGYTTTPNEISVEASGQTSNFTPHSGYGVGYHYWEKASSISSSSGWFIDKVEGFRRFNYTEKYFDGADPGYATNPGASNRWANYWSSDYTSIPESRMQVIGTGTAGSKAFEPNYLDTPDLNAGPLDPSTGNIMLMQEKNIIPSQGIDATENIIHLSYAGIGEDDDDESASAIPSWGLEGVAQHVNDLAFINELTTPGTLWRWKEDPDGTVYQTRGNSGGGYNSAVWGANTVDVDHGGEYGIGLYNHVTFEDYPIANHHKHTYSQLGVQLHSHDHTMLVSNPPEADHNSNYILPCGLVPCATADFLLENNLNSHNGTNKHTANYSSSGWEANNAWNRYPMQTKNWNKKSNRRKRYMFRATTFLGNDDLGSGPAQYLPTNNPLNAPWFDSSGRVLTSPPPTAAPGIRPDGMFAGSTAAGATVPGLTVQGGTPAGSVTWEILTNYELDQERYQSTNPAVFETEPKEDVGLDIYHEVGQIYPVTLNENNIEQFVGPLNPDITKNSKVTCFDSTGAPIQITTDTSSSGDVPSSDIRIESVNGNNVVLTDAQGILLLGITGQLAPQVDNILAFTRSDGSVTKATVIGVAPNVNFPAVIQYELDANVHNHEVVLPWFNCYSFGNGVESDRIRDDFNQVRIDKGPIASTTLEEPYAEERRSSGLIYSGIYNSMSGINNLNQFIQAEKITKDLNPVHGSIQKLFTRNTNLVTFCEDKVFKILANKDALFNADGNPQLTATSNVLGQTIPFVGEFGISKNPESFASESYRAYFTDKTRGAVLRLSQDGITPISDAGMKDYFADNLTNATRMVGSFDDKKQEYNLTIDSKEYLPITESINTFLLANVTLECAYFIDFSGNPTINDPTCGEYGVPLGATNESVLRIPISTPVAVNDIVSGPGIPPGTHVTTIHTDLACQQTTDGHIDPTNINAVSHPNYDGHPLSKLVYQDIRISAPVDLTAIDPAIVLEYMVYDNPSTLDPLANHPTLWGHPMSITIEAPTIYTSTPAVTASFSELAKGWTSFKSWHQENGISLNNKYYTFKGGQIWEHHANELRNNFYGDQYDSTVRVLFNESPGSVKSFNTINYEGSQSKITRDIGHTNSAGHIVGDGEYWDNIQKQGWYVDDLHTNLQEGDLHEFKPKEGKWFSQVKGVQTEWLDDGTAGNIDTKEFSYQGIDEAAQVLAECGEDEFGNPITGDDCYTSFNCELAENGASYCVEIQGTGGTYSTKIECLTDPGSPCQNVDSGPFDCSNKNGYCVPTPGGPYATILDCVNDSPCSHLAYDCDPSVGYCVPTPGGQYTGSSTESPEDECIRLTDCTWSDPYECINGICTPDLGGQYLTEAACLDDVTCVPDDPCSLPPTVSHAATDPTKISGVCQTNGSAEIVAILNNTAVQWDLELFNDQGVSLGVSGPYSSGGSATVANLAEGTYEYSVTDNEGCITFNTFVLECVETEAGGCEEPTTTLDTVNPTTTGGCRNGRAEVTVNLNPTGVGTASTWGVIWYQVDLGGNETILWADPGPPGGYSDGDTSANLADQGIDIFDNTVYTYKYYIFTDIDGCNFHYTFDLTCDPVAESYDCIDGACVDPGTGSGQYPTTADCLADSCGSPNGGCMDDSISESSTNADVYGNDRDGNPCPHVQVGTPGQPGSSYRRVCTDQNGDPYGYVRCNYDPLATYDNGSCCSIVGCTDPVACFGYYDSAAGCGAHSGSVWTDPCSDGSCVYGLFGCTITSGLNYYAGATSDSGCEFTDCPNLSEGFDIDSGISTYNRSSGIVPNSCADLEAYLLHFDCGYPQTSGQTILELAGYEYCEVLKGTADFDEPVAFDCIQTPGTGKSRPIIKFGNSAAALMWDSTETWVPVITANPPLDTSCCGAITGCTDSAACNYDPIAVYDDGSCCFEPGCNNPLAFNFNTNSCGGCFPNQLVAFQGGYSTATSTIDYKPSWGYNNNSLADCDDGSCDGFIAWGCMEGASGAFGGWDVPHYPGLYQGQVQSTAVENGECTWKSCPDPTATNYKGLVGPFGQAYGPVFSCNDMKAAVTASVNGNECPWEYLTNYTQAFGILHDGTGTPISEKRENHFNKNYGGAIVCVNNGVDILGTQFADYDLKMVQDCGGWLYRFDQSQQNITHVWDGIDYEWKNVSTRPPEVDCCTYITPSPLQTPSPSQTPLPNQTPTNGSSY